MSPQQRVLQQELEERYERIRNEKIDPRDDNALSITTDGRKLAIDARMLSATAPDFAESKVNALIRTVATIWKESEVARATQLVFCDMGVHPTPWGYSAYDEIVSKLRAAGVPRGEIAAIGDADSDAKKQSLFERVRAGQVRILLGSTQKMGTGMNVQKRLIALHHLDAPWKPSEVEQREGRILRQGNEHAEVAIYRYVTEGSFDAYVWQALETKARFIAQVMSGENVARKAEDIGGQELSYAEVKAIASGNPAILTLAEADAELQRLHLLKKQHLDEQFVARRSVRNLPTAIARLSARLVNLTADQATAHAHDRIVIGDQPCSLDRAPGAIATLLESIPKHVGQMQRVPFGIYRGLRFGMVLHPQFPPDVFLEGAVTRQTMLSREHHGPRAILNALERLVNDYADECNRVQQELAIAESQFRDYQTRLGGLFTHETILSEMTLVRDQLKACLFLRPPAQIRSVQQSRSGFGSPSGPLGALAGFEPDRGRPEPVGALAGFGSPASGASGPGASVGSWPFVAWLRRR